MDTYVLHSMVRRVQTRTKRVLSPKRHRFVQRLGGGEVTLRRGRSVPISKAMFERLLPELVQLEKEGILEVRTPGGQVIDLSTMKAAAPPKPKKKVEPKKATLDLPTASVPVYPEGKGAADEVEPPALTSTDLPEGHEPEPADPEPAPSDKGTSSRKKRSTKRSKK